MSRESLNLDLSWDMEMDLRFFSPYRQSIETTQDCFIKACKKNNWVFNTGNNRYDENIHAWCQRSETIEQEVIDLTIYCKDYTMSWYEEANLKPHISNEVTYIMYTNFYYNHGFALDFAIAFLEENPTSYAETLWANNDTYFDEYTLADLYEIKRLGYANNWAWYRRGKPQVE